MTKNYRKWIDSENYPQNLAHLADMQNAVYCNGADYRGVSVGDGVAITGPNGEVLLLKTQRAIRAFLAFLASLLPPEFAEFTIDEAYALQSAQNHR